MVGSLAALIVFEATFRAMQRALTRPARETLYTVVSREDKYKSKAFIDTFVYRGGDAARCAGSTAQHGHRLGLGLEAHGLHRLAARAGVGPARPAAGASSTQREASSAAAIKPVD